MLRELRDVQQVKGEPKRRWFFCHDIDLVVWEEAGGAICGFQLAYDKNSNEHSVVWDKERGFSHYLVDDGEPMAGVSQTPILHANGSFNRIRVLGQFLAVSSEIPAEISAFVEARLCELNGY